MPEGDVVRRTAAQLGRALAGRVLTRAELRWGDLGGVPLAGRTVTEVATYGKHLLIRLARQDRTPDVTVHAHLRMDGRWFIEATDPGRRFTDHRIRAVLGNSEWTAIGQLLGELDVLPTADECVLLGRLGPDIMADDFPDAGLRAALDNLARAPQRAIGAALLDQTVVAGIGTIFMSESLFRRRVSPWRAGGEVDAAPVLQTARDLLLRSAGATSAKGADRRYVHGRAGRPCYRCGTAIRVAPIGDPPFDRPAFHCPTCQPAPTRPAPTQPAPTQPAPTRPRSTESRSTATSRPGAHA
jgi:endonuclease-8